MIQLKGISGNERELGATGLVTNGSLSPIWSLLRINPVKSSALFPEDAREKHERNLGSVSPKHSHCPCTANVLNVIWGKVYAVFLYLEKNKQKHGMKLKLPSKPKAPGLGSQVSEI